MGGCSVLLGGPKLVLAAVWFALRPAVPSSCPPPAFSSSPLLCFSLCPPLCVESQDLEGQDQRGLGRVPRLDAMSDTETPSQGCGNRWDKAPWRPTFCLPHMTPSAGGSLSGEEAGHSPSRPGGEAEGGKPGGRAEEGAQVLVGHPGGERPWGGLGLCGRGGGEKALGRCQKGRWEEDVT